MPLQKRFQTVGEKGYTLGFLFGFLLSGSSLLGGPGGPPGGGGPATEDFYWDDEASADSKWTTAENWDPNEVPEGNPNQTRNIFFQDDAGAGSQSVDASAGEEHNVTRVTIDHSDAYTISGGTLQFSSGARELKVDDQNGPSSGSVTHTVGSDMKPTQGADTLFIRNDASNADLQIDGKFLEGKYGLTFDGEGDTTIGSSISGSKIGATKNGSGTLTYTGNNTYQGQTVINGGTVLLNNADGEAISASSESKSKGIVVNDGGTLRWGQNNQISDNAMDVELSGGTLDTDGHDDTLDSLTLTADSTIDFGSGSSTLTFNNGSEGTWDSDSTLFVDNWSGDFEGDADDQLIFGSSDSGLSNTEVGQIVFRDPNGRDGNFNARILGDGEVVPVPEASTVVAGIVVLGLIGMDGYRRYRRKKNAETLKC